jgi:hypothetical protein
MDVGTRIESEALDSQLQGVKAVIPLLGPESTVHYCCMVIRLMHATPRLITAI